MLGACQEFLLKEWDAKFCHGYEADDAIGINHNPENTVVVSIDKDMKQLPGEHYNFVKYEWEIIDEDTAEFNFWCQMLIGDSTDNVRGVDGIGKAKAPRILTGMSKEQMYETVKNLYNDDERFLMNFRLLRILRSPVEYERILEEIDYQNSISKEQGEDVTETSSEHGTGELPTAHA
jgi:5'-3' exonuclease